MSGEVEFICVLGHRQQSVQLEGQLKPLESYSVRGSIPYENLRCVVCGREGRPIICDNCKDCVAPWSPCCSCKRTLVKYKDCTDAICE